MCISYFSLATYEFMTDAARKNGGNCVEPRHLSKRLYCRSYENINTDFLVLVVFSHTRLPVKKILTSTLRPFHRIKELHLIRIWD